MAVPVHLFGNVGFTPEMVTPSILRRPDLESIVLFYGPDPRSETAVADIEKVAQRTKTPVRKVPLKDAFDPAGAFEAYLDAYEALAPPRDVIFNAAGGTGVLVAAAMSFAIALGLPCVYVRRETGEEISYPSTLFAHRYAWLESHRRMLAALGEGPKNVKDVAEATGLSQGRVSVLANDLEAAGYVTHRRDGREKYLDLAPFARLLLRIDARAVHRLGSGEMAMAQAMREWLAHGGWTRYELEVLLQDPKTGFRTAADLLAVDPKRSKTLALEFKTGRTSRTEPPIEALKAYADYVYVVAPRDAWKTLQVPDEVGILEIVPWPVSLTDSTRIEVREIRKAPQGKPSPQAHDWVLKAVQRKAVKTPAKAA